jgi:hypothetical protein
LFSNPTLPPQAVVSQLTPSNQLCGLEEHRLNFYLSNRGSGIVKLNYLADPKALLLNDGFDRPPLGQQQFFGIHHLLVESC